MSIKTREECFDGWGWASRLAPQAKFSAATYSREWLSMCTDRQQLHPGLVQDGFRVVGSAEKHSSVSISGPQLRRRHHRAAPWDARHSPAGQKVLLKAPGPHRREGGCHERVCVHWCPVCLCWVGSTSNYSCPALASSLHIRGRSFSFLARA